MVIADELLLIHKFPLNIHFCCCFFPLSIHCYKHNCLQFNDLIKTKQKHKKSVRGFEEEEEKRI